MTRRSAFLVTAVLLVVVLVGGRWLALETAERAWAATFAGGSALVEARTLARLLHALVLLFSITWTTGNVFVVYRAIGSVQLPRRLGNLEIVEAVPQRVLHALTLGIGVVGGIILAWGAGDWWRVALLAASPPHFGQTDQILGLDLGYYVGVLPWRVTLQEHAMALTVGVTAAVALLYVGIGSLRFHLGRLHASDHARAHCAVLLACLAVVVAWGATLDPAEVVGGLHGAVDQALLDVRLPGAAFVMAVAVAAAVASLAWGWRDRPNLLLGAWAALLLAVAACYLIVPAIVRASGPGASGGRGRGAGLAERRATLEGEAFGLTPLAEGAPPGLSSLAAAAQELPLWDVERVGTVAGVPPNAVTLWSGRSWLVAPSRIGVENDGELTFHAVAGADGHVLLWRRDVADRLGRLAPFATFGEPAPALDGGERGRALWWISWGYVASEAFPLARSLPWRDRPVRYLRAGLVGAVHATTGETHVWLAPGYDSVTAAWARHFAPLVEPPDRIPAAVLNALDYPPEAFQLAAAQLARAGGEGDSSVWTLRPHRPFRLALARRWTGVALEAGTPHRFAGLLAGEMTPEGPRLRWWRPGAPEHLPSEVVGSAETKPGELRIWPAAGVVLTLQAQFAQPAGERAQPRVERVYVSLGERTGEGLSTAAALRALLTGQGHPFAADTSLAARWDQARRLAARADSALAAGNLQEFGRLYRELVRLLAPAPRPR